MYAMWIASVANIDWPSVPGLSAQEQRSEYLGWLDVAEERGLDTVVVHIRPSGDVMWPSRYEPWSQWLTGEQGADPGYDPLGFMVEETHARGLSFHAWFNPYRAAREDRIDRLHPSHPAVAHPDWTIPYAGKLHYNPGLPEVRRFVQDAICDAVERYAVDGVHFDDFFYPYPVEGEEFDDVAAHRTYGAGTDLGDWRRRNVDLLISELSERLPRIRPDVRFGISPFGVWRNRSNDPSGSDTRAAVQCYDDLYADIRRWIREGWIDYVVPQLYWHIGHPETDYAELLSWWAAQVDGTGVDLYIGQATYKVGNPTEDADPAWADPHEMRRHLELDRATPAVGGEVYFSAKHVRADRLGHFALLG